MTAVQQELTEPDSTKKLTWVQRLSAPCDAAGTAFFRFAFGGIMLVHVLLYFRNGLIDYYFGAATHHLTYYGFGWVQALDGDGMRRLYYLMAMSAVGVSLGLLYRLSAVTLFVTFTWAFLAEAGQFQNHYYLMCLLSFLLIFIPAHRSFSIDAVLFPDKASAFIPCWCPWILMFQIAVPYLYGGFAKIDGDWLHGLPVGIWISTRSDLPVIGPLLTERWMEWFICYAGLIIDLAAVPLLLWKRTRIAAAGILTAFHLCNSVLFPIDVFPWMSILALSIFFEPGWPRRLLRLPQPEAPALTAQPPDRLAPRLVLGLAGLYLAWQLLFPFRHLLYPGNASWTEEGQQFAWRMMLRTKGVFIRVYATDELTGQTVEVPITEFLSQRQLIEFAQSPYQILATAPFFAERSEAVGLRNVQIRAVVITSLNGRKAQLMLDPELDLLTIKPSLWPQPGIIALTERRRTEPWDVPSDNWPTETGIRLPTTVPPPSLKGGPGASMF